MTEEKTFEEVLLNLLKQGFQITFDNYDLIAFYKAPIFNGVVVTIKKNDYKTSRWVPEDRLADGLRFCVREFNRFLTETIKKEIEN